MEMSCVCVWFVLTALIFCNVRLCKANSWRHTEEEKPMQLDFKAVDQAVDQEKFNQNVVWLDTARKLPNDSEDGHVINARNVGVHSVLNERLQEQQVDYKGNVTRNEELEIQKARITVVVSCGLMVFTTVIFAAFVYFRIKSKRLNGLATNEYFYR